jgi:hypothetical protein
MRSFFIEFFIYVFNTMLILKIVIYSTCNFTLIHSLTGPVGQPFASCLGVSKLHPGNTQTHNGTRFLLLALSRYIGDPNVIRSLALPPFSGCFTRICANIVKSRLDHTSHAFPGSIPFFVGPPPSQHSDWLEPWSSCWGEPCGGPAILLQYTVSLVKWSTVCFPSRGSAVCVLGMHKLTMESGFSC